MTDTRARVVRGPWRTPRPPFDPADDVRVVLESLMHALQDVRQQLLGRVRVKYEELRCELARAGLKVGSLERFDRAKAERRLGELAEQRGDTAAAIAHYRRALATWSGVGIKNRLRRLEQQ